MKAEEIFSIAMYLVLAFATGAVGYAQLFSRGPEVKPRSTGQVTTRIVIDHNIVCRSDGSRVFVNKHLDFEEVPDTGWLVWPPGEGETDEP